MEKVALRQKRVEADVLCVGGGIAGLMAAIRASELGAKVVVVDKANTLYSGSGGGGGQRAGSAQGAEAAGDGEPSVKPCATGVS